MKQPIRRLVVIAVGAAALGTGAVATASPASAGGDLCAQGYAYVAGVGDAFGGCYPVDVGNGSDCAWFNQQAGPISVGALACVPAVG